MLKKQIYSFIILILFSAVQLHSQTPIKVNSGTLTATKTYMHVFVENPSGTKLAYRYFADSNDQPISRDDVALGCVLMLSNSDLSGHTKLYDITDNERGHGSEAMIWTADDRLYYNGRLFNTTTKSIIWNKREDINGGKRIRAWREPKNGKLYVNIRYGDDKGYYWLDPTSSTKPELHTIFNSSNLDTLFQYWNGTLASTEPSYIYPSPDGSKLYIVIYENINKKQYSFVTNNDGSNEVLLRNDINNLNYLPWDGHTVWYDNNTLIKGNGLYLGVDYVLSSYNLISNTMIPVGGEGNHLSISPNKQWLVGDIGHPANHRKQAENGVYLYKYGSMDGTPISIKYLDFGNYHSSFSRDGTKVYFQAQNDANNYQQVYYTDINNLINNKIDTGKTEAEHLPFERTNYTVEKYINPLDYSSNYSWVKATSSIANLKAQFIGISGLYKVTVRYRDEFDGVSIFKLYVGGSLEDTWTADAVAGSNGSNDIWALENDIVFINTNDEIKIVGEMNLSEFARIDWVNITRAKLLYKNIKNNSDYNASTEFKLKQNYPNPFNPNTEIIYTLDESSFINLEIYDITGRLVKTLESGYKNAGIYKVEFSPQNLASGVYLYKLSSKNRNIIKKMLLLK